MKLSKILFLSMDSFRFGETYLRHTKLFVGEWSAIFPFLGGWYNTNSRQKVLPKICIYICCIQNMYMGWLRWVGSLKLKDSFAEYRLFYRALSQKRLIILKEVLIYIFAKFKTSITLEHVGEIVIWICAYGVATISGFLKIIGLFYRISSLL